MKISNILIAFALLALTATGLMACGEDETTLTVGDKKLSVSHK